ncbi:MAG TPA: DUF2249 domain-containing protein [Bacteroidales bacterium]|nr:DUF2249 domain-containing protein [Bacteroidales bacterium]
MDTPSWLQKEKIRIILDARPMLASGEHPLARVLQETGRLSAGEIYEIITPFIPSPMIEKVTATGFDAFVKQEGPAEVRTYFHKL